MTPHHHDPMATKLEAAKSAADWSLLARLCRQALRKNGRHPLAHRLLGFALYHKGDIEPAFAAYRQATALWPRDAELLINFANVLLGQLRNQEALPLLEKVVALRPDHSVCWCKLAQCCYLIGLHQKGFDASQQALTSAVDVPQRVNALTQSALHRRELGQIKEAIADCEQAISLAPDADFLYTNCMLFMLADADRGIDDVVQVARTYGAKFGEPWRSHWPDYSAIDHAPWRRLRIGFVSPDFRSHAVMYFVEGLLAQLDRRMFEVVAFYLYPSGDHITKRVECHVDRFIRIDQMNAQQRFQAIRDAQIDIAIDLTGHTGSNALDVLMRKPAPIQISWLGYPATTGLAAVDYKFTDEVTDPPGADDQYDETLYRLPTLFCCYRPMIRGPLLRYQPMYQVQPTPALRNGYITFGTCNNLGKLTDQVLALWGRIVQSIPGSRLLVEGKNLSHASMATSFRQRCDRLGLDSERLILVEQETKNQYLTYHRIDIALDPFPLTGGTTTFDTLWMGVPLVSMSGDSFKSRMGVGILSYLGRTEWLVDTEDEYLRVAQTLAADVNQLNQLRLGLRDEVEQSPLMREDLYTHLYGEGLRVMWLRWLAQQQHPEDEAAQQQAMAQWVQEFPQEWSTPAAPSVGLEPGKRVPLAEAHALLQTLVDRAKSLDTPHGDSIEDRRWISVTELAEKVLCAVPHDPVALACLAEVEHAHGHTEFAVTYLQYATKAMA